MKIKCPECGETKRFAVTETYVAYHPVTGIKAQTQLVLSSAFEEPFTNVSDGASDYKFLCRECGHTWDIPSGLDITWE